MSPAAAFIVSAIFSGVVVLVVTLTAVRLMKESKFKETGDIWFMWLGELFCLGAIPWGVWYALSVDQAAGKCYAVEGVVCGLLFATLGIAILLGWPFGLFLRALVLYSKWLFSSK